MNMRRLSRITLESSRQRRAARLPLLAGSAAAAIVLCAALLTCFAQSPPAADAKVSAPSAASSPGPKPETALAATPGQNDAPRTSDPEQQRLAGQCAQLLQMAAALKSEVDKTTKDTLSIPVVRKAGEIEQWAHKAKSGTGKG